MTNRQRLGKTFNHDLSDRVPALVYARAEVERGCDPAAARDPWAWTTPIRWEETNK